MTRKEQKRECARKKFEEEYKPAYDAFIKLYPFTTESLDGEIWLPINPEYHCSNFGRIKSFKREEPKIMKPFLHQGGYLFFGLRIDGKDKNFLAHRLVAKLFIPNPENLPQVDHVYGMKFDCSVWNLHWTTGVENTRAAVNTGLIKSGEDAYKAKLTNEQVLYIRENPDGLNQYQLAEKFDVAPMTISYIQRGKIYKNAGGKIRECRIKMARIPDEIRAKIRAEYVKGSREFALVALAKKYGIDPATIRRIVNEQSAE